MVEKHLDYSSKEYDEALNHEFSGRQQRCHYSNRKKQLDFEDYDLKALMDDYYTDNDRNHQDIQ